MHRIVTVVLFIPFACVMAFFACMMLTTLDVINPYPTPPTEAMNYPHFGRVRDVKFHELKRHEGEPEKQYFDRLTHDVADYIVHWWPAEYSAAVEVSPWVNYLLWLKSFQDEYKHFGDYEFVNPETAWKRGYGFCTQSSRIVYSVLKDQGYDPTIITHPNHTIVEVKGNIIDADYGVFIPYTAAYMQKNLGLIPEYYKGTPEMIPLLTKIYSDGWVASTRKDTLDYMRWYELNSANLKWLPVIALGWITFAIWDAVRCWPKFRSIMRKRKLSTAMLAANTH